MSITILFIIMDKKIVVSNNFWYYYFWCLERESNQWHRDFQSLALPTELSRLIIKLLISIFFLICFPHHFLYIKKWRPGTGSNRRPLAWQASVLTNWTTGPYKKSGGRNRARTYDPLLVRQMLSQLSYATVFFRRVLVYYVFNFLSILFLIFFILSFKFFYFI